MHRMVKRCRVGEYMLLFAISRELPLRGNYDEGKYKLYYFDTGMLVAMLDEEAQEDLRATKI